MALSSPRRTLLGYLSKDHKRLHTLSACCVHSRDEMTHHQTLDDTGMEEIRVRFTGASSIACRTGRLSQQKSDQYVYNGEKEQAKKEERREEEAKRLVSCLREKTAGRDNLLSKISTSRLVASFGSSLCMHANLSLKHEEHFFPDLTGGLSSDRSLRATASLRDSHLNANVSSRSSRGSRLSVGSRSRWSWMREMRTRAWMTTWTMVRRLLLSRSAGDKWSPAWEPMDSRRRKRRPKCSRLRHDTIPDTRTERHCGWCSRWIRDNPGSSSSRT